MYAPAGVHPAHYLRGILQIVDRIYAAVCGEIPWEQTLGEVFQVGRLSGCALSLVDRLERRRVVMASYGPSFAAEPEAILGPMESNPNLMNRILWSRPGAIWQDRQNISDVLSTTTSFRLERTPSNCVSAWACLVVAGDDRQVVCLEAYAGAGRTSCGPELHDFLRDLAPHLTRAWRVGRTSRLVLPGPLRPASPSEPDVNGTPAPDRPSLPGVARLRLEFGLTKAEARLALRLAEGSSLASAAQAFGVKLTTIRSQLQQVFAKTGTSRQTELVAMLLSRGHGPRGALPHPQERERQASALAEPGS